MEYRLSTCLRQACTKHSKRQEQSPPKSSASLLEAAWSPGVRNKRQRVRGSGHHTKSLCRKSPGSDKEHAQFERVETHRAVVKGADSSDVHGRGADA